jgi:hypothetical protein
MALFAPADTRSPSGLRKADESTGERQDHNGHHFTDDLDETAGLGHGMSPFGS